MRKLSLLVFILCATFVSKAQVLLNESFNVTTITATPPAGWTVSGSPSNTNTGCSVNGLTIMQVPSGGFNCTVNGTPAPRPNGNTGSGMAGWNSWDIALGGTSELVSPSLNFSTPGATYLVSFWVYNQATLYLAYDSLSVFVNTSPTSAGGVKLYGNIPNYNTPPVGWTQYTYAVPSSFTGTTNYLIFRTYSGYGYDVFFDDIVVRTQSPPPPSPFTSNTPVCPYSTITLTAAAPVGYPNPTFSLTGPGISTPLTNTTGIFNITNASASNVGTYSVTVTSGGFTSPASTTTVALYPTPTGISAGNVVIPTTCLSNNGSFQVDGLGASATFTSLKYRKNGGVTITVPGPIVSNAAGSYTVTGIGPGSYDSIRLISSGSNCTTNVAGPITVASPNPPPTPVLAYPVPLCPNSNLTIVVTNPQPNSTYKWSGPNVPPNTTGTSYTRNNVTSADNGTYTVLDSVLGGGGCTSIGNIVVTVSSPDPPPTAFYVTYCQFDTAVPIIALASQPGAIVNFYDAGVSPGPLLSQSPNPGPIPSTLVATTLTYWVSQTKICESAKVPLYVLIKPRPLPPAAQSNTITYCQYDIASPLSASGANVRWFATPTGGIGNATAPTPSTLVPGTYYFYASQTVGGCESQRLTIAVLVKPKPQPPLVTSPLNLCQNDPIAPLTAIGQNLLWYTIPNGGVGVPVAPLPNTGYEDSFKYFVTQTVLGCESDRALIAVKVNYKPNGIITASSQSVCQDAIDTFFYYGNARNDADFNWFAPLSATFVSGQGTRGPVVIHFDTAGSSVIHLTINNKGCISGLLSAPITVRPLPKISFINRQDVCEDDLVNVALNHTEDGISGYMWGFGSDDIKLEYGVITTGGPFGVRYPHASATPYQISATATKDGCTSKPIFQDVYVHARPDARITSGKSPVDICASDTLFLTVPAVPEGAIYTWSPSAYFQGHKDTLNNEVFAVVSMNSEVKVHIRTAFGCEADDSIAVTTKPCCGLVFPNVFAPGGNIEKNRLFRPITTGVHRINSFRIINRWGQVVYESKIERNGWDGTLNGTPQDMGTYYYYINYRCDGKNVEDQGEFLLLR